MTFQGAVSESEATQQVNGIEMTSYQCRCDVTTPHGRHCDVILTRDDILFTCEKKAGFREERSELNEPFENRDINIS